MMMDGKGLALIGGILAAVGFYAPATRIGRARACRSTEAGERAAPR